MSNVQSLTDSAYVSIRFEGLCEQPQVTLNKILDFLAITPEVAMDYDSLIKKRPTQLMPTVAKNQERIVQKLALYYKFHNYPTVASS